MWSWDTTALRFDNTCWTYDGSVTCWFYMAHYREQIRKAVVAAVTGLTTTGANVQDGPLYNLKDTTAPTLAVWAKTSTPDYERAQMQQSPLWQIEIVIEGYVKEYTNLIDTLDDIASEVETAVYSDAALLLLVNNYIECADQTIEIENEGNEPVGKIEIIYNMYYHAREGAPDIKV